MKFEDRVKAQVKRAYDELCESVEGFSHYDHEIQLYAIIKLVGYAFNNNLGIKEDEFPYKGYYGIGVKFCDSKKNSATLNDEITHAYNGYKRTIR